MENKREETNEESKANVEKKKLDISKIFKVLWNIFSKIITILILFVSIIIVVQKVTKNRKYDSKV